MIVVVSWLLIGAVLCVLGRFCDNMAILGIGAVMVLAVSAITAVSV